MAKKNVVKKKADKKAEKSKKPALSKASAVAKKALKPAGKKVVAKKAPVAKKAAKPAKPILKKALKAVGKAAVKVAEKISPKKAAVDKPIVATKVTAPIKPAPEKSAKKEKPVKAKVVVEPPPEELIEAAGEIEEEASDEVVLTDAEGRRYCRVKDCDQLSSVDGYCRYHYLLFWKKIQVRKKILTEGKLERYIEELTARYPDKFLDMLRKDLRSDKEFLAAIAELEIDESAAENEFEDEAQTYIDEVRGMGEPAARDEEDF